jgi:glyoxylase-like metal-dependent hydrolase (beta-lactamase superfamily II)
LIPLRTGELEVNKSSQTYFWDWDQKMWASVFIWYIKGPSEHILIDAGDIAPNEEGYLVAAVGLTKAKGKGPDSVKLALESVGLTPDDIDTLILTHLHRDHVGGIKLFRNSRVIVQKSELEFAHHPMATQSADALYPRELIAALGEFPHLEVIDGEQKIADGVEVITVPGHTPGTQAVSVETKKGRVVMASDAVPLYHNWYPAERKYGTPNNLLKRIPPGIHYDLRQSLESMDKIQRIADIVVPSHDGYVLSDFQYWA